MKLSALAVNVCILLLILSSVLVVEAQRKKTVKKAVPRDVQIDPTSITIPEIKDFAFIVEIDKNADVAVRIQKTENNEFLGNASADRNLTDFFSAFSLLQDGKTSLKTPTALNPIVIIKADESLNLGKIVEVIKSLRVSPKQKIKLQISRDYFVGIPPLINEKDIIIRPNPSFLLVGLQDDSKILLNTEAYGDFNNTAPLKEKLDEIFKMREATGIFRYGTNEIEKTVFVAAPDSVKFGDLVKLIQEIAAAGAEPVGLQMEVIEKIKVIR
jgi:biopolymer transport protein ExbD